ncbi:hypothetical protein [Clostridium sp. HBUAS56010]|uniref:hypothetical protein n=1 Tax=Clostridium sp. HBUAS56010 TaxID=2571127 RepID=UPI001FA9F97F|nr:hypothetical protein [Clostridium sp. HBUAS56010]
MTVKKHISLDFIMIKFDFGVEEDDSVEGEYKPPVSAEDLRKYYYENGAEITWQTYDSETGKVIPGSGKTIIYRMLMRSPGKAKEGHCIFIRDDLLNKTRKYLTMGLWDRMENVKGAQIVELSAYAPLITATAIDYINIPLENIFVLKDEKVSVFKKAVAVGVKDIEYFRTEKDFPQFEEYINKFNLTFYQNKAKKNPNLVKIERTKKALKEYGIDISLCPTKKVKDKKKQCYVDRGDEPAKITNVLWDGMGLVDDSIFPSDATGFIYCRSHFFKSCLFRGKIQEYFKDNYGKEYETAYETDMIGRRIKVTDIKVIVTENSLKWIKFIKLMSKDGSLASAFNYYNEFMKKDGERFAIVKTAHTSKWGDLQRSSFQMNNTLLTRDYNVLREIAKESIDYCNSLKLSDEAFLRHLDITGSAKYSINNILIDLYRINDEFRYMEYFKRKKRSIINEFKDQRLKLGKLLQQGDNLTICGNPVAMLRKVVSETKKNFLDEQCFKTISDGIQCYTTRFPENEYIAGFRSPHNSPNNIVHLENIYPEKIIRYFPDLSDNVIIINGIGTDVQSRLNGQDLDTDSIFATNQKDIVKLAKKAYLYYPTIVNDIKTIGTSEYDKSMESYAIMDSNISKAQYSIGYASNIAQLALSYYFDVGCNNRDLENIFIMCSVLAQVAIDSAKRNFEIKVSSELSRISNMECMKREPRYPVFYADVQKNNNKRKKGKKLEIKKIDVASFNCPMDILYKIINNEIINLTEHKDLNTKIYKEKDEGVKPIFEYDEKLNNRKQYPKVISIVKEYRENVHKIEKSNDNYHVNRLNEFELCMKKLKNITINKNTMGALINYSFAKGNEDIRDSLLIVLYDKNREQFLKCFKKTEKTSQEVT